MGLPVPSLDHIRSQIAPHRPLETPEGQRPNFEAAVALVLHQPEGGETELLFIERAHREGDPWSGHMAFPGGRRDAADVDLEATAGREKREEVGLSLPGPIGSLDHFNGSGNPRVPPLLVAPYVYELAGRPELDTNHEVESTVWVPISWILDSKSWMAYEFERENVRMAYPAFEYEGYVVWGLTYRILRSFFAVLGREIPAPPDEITAR